MKLDAGAGERTGRAGVRAEIPDSGAAAEGGGLASHGVRLVDEELDTLATREDLLNVLDHDILYLREFGLCPV